MAKTVLVQHYALDGAITETRMTMRAWNKKFMEMGQCQGDFYLVWWKLQKRWDGATRRELHSTCCQVGFKVEVNWRCAKSALHCTHGYKSNLGCVVPVLVPIDE